VFSVVLIFLQLVFLKDGYLFYGDVMVDSVAVMMGYQSSSAHSFIRGFYQELEITAIQYLSKSLQSAQFNRPLNKTVFTTVH